MAPKDTRNAKAKAATKATAPAVRAGVSGNPTVHEGASGCTDALCGLVDAVEELGAAAKGPARRKVSVVCGEALVAIVVTTWPVALV